MTGKRWHPGHTGGSPWADWKLTAEGRLALQRWLQKCEFTRLDETAFLDSIESIVRMYLRMKAGAPASAPKAIRKNLKRVVDASRKLVDAIEKLDGNSDRLLREKTRGLPPQYTIRETHRSLELAHSYAVERFQVGGRRPEHELDMMAACLAEALEIHTSAIATSTRGQIFEGLLRETFALLGKARVNLHTLAERVLERQLVTGYAEGSIVFTPYELAPKRRR
jgi:hypothetical protein